jgi:hypothetical protein
VACRAVNVQVNVTVRPTDVACHGLLSSLSSANRLTLPWQLRSPFGPSTLCGSHLMESHATVPRAHCAWRLGGVEM